MKKSAIVLLIVITVGFAGFVAGFYVGRNYNHQDIQVSATQITTTAAPNTTTLPSVPAPSVTGPSNPLPTATSNGLININTATLEQLDTLPGIGPKLAQAIIDYRNEYGPFTCPEDLVNVSGIGEKTLEKLLDFITVGG